MSDFPIDPKQAAEQYLGDDDHIVDTLGGGIDGIVYSTSRASAIKIHRRRKQFLNELDVYRRLQECGVADVAGHAVPELIGWDDDSFLLEVTIVRPPYVLDFANSTLDWPPDFPPEAWEEWLKQRSEEFGHDWPHALGIFNELQHRWGVFHMDFSPRNIAFVPQG